MSFPPAFSTLLEDSEVTASPKLRAAFQWWQDCWLRHSAEQEENLRDGVLQDALVLRRGIELALLTGLSPSSSELVGWLGQLEFLYQNLDRLGDRLNPPYIEDDLNLALQHMMGSWIDKYPGIILSIQYPQGLSDSGFNSILLFSIEQLLRLFSQLQDLGILHVFLTKNDTLSILRLSLGLTLQEPDKIRSVIQKIEYLQFVFPALVNGCLAYSYSPGLLNCEFSWKSIHL